MSITEQIQIVQNQIEATGAAVGGPVEEASARLSVIIEPALRLSIQQALAEAAASLNQQLDGIARIELRLENNEPVLVAIPEERDPVDTKMTPQFTPVIQGDEIGNELGGDGPSTRFTLRIPNALKERADSAASAEGVSLNTWFVRAASRSLTGPSGIRSGRNTLSGWLA